MNPYYFHGRSLRDLQAGRVLKCECSKIRFKCASFLAWHAYNKKSKQMDENLSYKLHRVNHAKYTVKDLCR